MTAITSNTEEPVVDPMPRRRSARLLIKRERARKQAEEELKRRQELQLAEQLDQQLPQQRQTRNVKRLSQQKVQPALARNMQMVPKPRQKRKRIQDQEQNDQIQVHCCVCAEINGEYYKLYDLPDQVEFVVPKESRGL